MAQCFANQPQNYAKKKLDDPICSRTWVTLDRACNGMAGSGRQLRPAARPTLGPQPATRAKAVPAGQNLNIKIRFAQLSRQQEGRAGAKNCHLELHPHRQSGEARGADIGGCPQMWIFCRPRWMLVVVLAHTSSLAERRPAPSCPF